MAGQNKDSARSTLINANLKVKLKERESDQPAGQVLGTDPAAGTTVPEGSTVTVFYSDGPESVPGVVGLQRKDAERIIKDAGFEPRVVESTATTEPKGTVIDQSPEEGQTASEGSTVTIVVSAYEEPTEEPSPTETPSETPTESPSATSSPLFGQRKGAA